MAREASASRELFINYSNLHQCPPRSHDENTRRITASDRDPCRIAAAVDHARSVAYDSYSRHAHSRRFEANCGEPYTYSEYTPWRNVDQLHHVDSLIRFMTMQSKYRKLSVCMHARMHKVCS